MTTNTCKTCKYWDKVTTYGYCDKIDYDIVRGKEPKANEAVIAYYVHDDSGLDMKLKTDKDFSCSYHCPR